MKLIIAGSRDFNDYELLKRTVDDFVTGANELRIISGHAKGADKLGEKYALEKNLDLDVFYPDWEYYGKSAGMVRNKRMADHATHCIAFWDGKSKGTKGMIQIAKEKRLILKVVMLNKDKNVQECDATGAK